MENEDLKGLSLCDACYQAADQEQAATRECDVCMYRSKLTEFRNILSMKDGRIEDLETQVGKLKRQLKDSESQLLDGIGVVDKGCETNDNTTSNSTTNNKSNNNDDDATTAPVDRSSPPDSRPHVMLVGDYLFGKLRKAPHFIYEHLGRIPRLVSRTKHDAGVLDMARNAIDCLANDKVSERKFHILWLGGLRDTTQEDYARKAYFERLLKSLTDLQNHERVLSVNWCTLPESAHNAEAREINEYMTTWINEKGDRTTDERTPVKLIDLRYISRRDGTMEVNEVMWTPRGSALVSESLKKVLREKLEFTEKELEGIESSSKAMLEAREKKERIKSERKAKHEANLQEQQLRKQQKLAKQVLLKAGHAIPGSGAGPSTARKNGGSGNGMQRQAPKNLRARLWSTKKAAPGGGAAGSGPPMSTKRKPIFEETYSAPVGAHSFQSDYSPNSETFPVRASRSDPYFEGWTTKRSRLSTDETYYPTSSISDPYYRKEDYYRRSPPVSNSSPYDNNKFLPPHGREQLCDVPHEQIRRLQWDAYDRSRT